MSNDRPVGTIAVVDSGRLSRRTIAAVCHSLQPLVEDGTIPTIEVIREDDMKKTPMAMAALMASSPPSLLDAMDGPEKRPKEPVPEDVQTKRIAAAEAKRERRRQKRLSQRG